MAIATISQIKAAVGVGVRPNLFRVSFAGGLVGTTTSDLSFLVKSAALPGSTVGLIEVPNIAGRRLKLTGDRTFADWTVTVVNDRDFTVRKQIEAYQKLFVNWEQSGGTVGTGTRNDVALTTATVEQLNQAGTAIRTYSLKNCFVTDISTIDLSYDTTDAIEEFTVTWVYDYYTVS